MTKGIKTFRIYGNDVEMWLKQNNVEYSIMASDEYFMEVWHEDMPICALI